MAFMSIDEPEFWGHLSKKMGHVVGGGLSGVSTFILGDKKENPPTVVALRMGPGWVLPRHAHDCHRFEVVVQGTLDVGDRILKTGDIMISDPGVAYGPHVAGPEGCTTFEIFSNLRASYITLLDTPEGRIECDVSTPEGLKRMQTAMRAAKRVVKQAAPN